MPYSGTLEEVRAKRAAAQRRRLAADPVKRAAQVARTRAWRAENRDKVRDYKRKWNAANPEKALGYVRAAMAKYGGSYRAQKRAAYLRDKADYLARAGKRRAVLLRAMPLWLSDRQLLDIGEWYNLAASLGKVVDHIVPLQGKNVCGLHVGWNMQLLTDAENRSKGNRLTEAAYE